MRFMGRKRTNLAEWLSAQNRTARDLAGSVREDRARIQHYVDGRSVPRPAMLKKLKAETGLPSDAFLFPFDRIAG